MVVDYDNSTVNSVIASYPVDTVCKYIAESKPTVHFFVFKKVFARILCNDFPLWKRLKTVQTWNKLFLKISDIKWKNCFGK